MDRNYETVLKLGVFIVEKKPAIEIVFELVKGIVKAFIVFLIIRAFVLNLTEVQGRSMQPTLNDGEQIIVWQLFYKPGLFDVIVLEYTEGIYHVKRILGTPGDRVDYIDGEMFINGELIDEPYIYDGPSTRGFHLEQLCQFDCEVIPEGYFLVLGDYREWSGDSRNYGLVHRSQIVGRGIWRVSPFSEFGTFR